MIWMLRTDDWLLAERMREQPVCGLSVAAVIRPVDIKDSRRPSADRRSAKQASCRRCDQNHKRDRGVSVFAGWPPSNHAEDSSRTAKEERDQQLKVKTITCPLSRLRSLESEASASRRQERAEAQTFACPKNGWPRSRRPIREGKSPPIPWRITRRKTSIESPATRVSSTQFEVRPHLDRKNGKRLRSKRKFQAARSLSFKASSRAFQRATLVNIETES